MKRLPVLFLFLLSAALVWAVQNCPACNFRIKSDAISCPKCLRLLKWPHAPARTIQAKVVVRTGKDAFIRHPRSQNRAWKSNRNAGADQTGQIGSWGFLTGLRYLICFDIERAFSDANVDLNTFRLKRARLRLVVADRQINQQVPIRVYPLDRPFQEGSGRFHVRSKEPDGCTWEECAPMISWHVSGGDYSETPSAEGVLGLRQQRETIIDVTSIFLARFAQFQKSGVWNDPGLIIMRDPLRHCDCTFLNIYSLENSFRGQQVLSPQLFLE